MKKIVALQMAVFITVYANSQNIGIGTTNPTEKLDVNGNVNISGILKLNSIVGTYGDVLTTSGSGLLWSKGIYTLDVANYLSVNIPAENYVRINGIIILAANYSGLNGARLFVTGGIINGNGKTLTLGSNAVFYNVTFNNVDINANNATFYNCTFNGVCPRLGGPGCKFENSSFSTISMAGTTVMGNISNSVITNCDLPKLSNITGSEISGSSLGYHGFSPSLSSITSCKLYSSRIYGISNDFVFASNQCNNIRIYIGAGFSSPTNANVVGNQFVGLYTGANDVIIIDPSNTSYKLYTIQNNTFQMQPANPSCIAVSTNEGNPLGYGFLNIQGNTFWRSASTLSYSTNMKVNYSQNVSFGVAHPVGGGGLGVNGNFSY